MNLLIPFTDADIWTWAGLVAAEITHQVHRFRTPFKPIVTQTEKGVRVQVERRFGWRFPSEAKVENNYSGGHPLTKFIGAVKADEDGADEKLIEYIVDAKTKAKRWSRRDEDVHDLYKMARRALKS